MSRPDTPGVAWGSHSAQIEPARVASNPIRGPTHGVSASP